MRLSPECCEKAKKTTPALLVLPWARLAQRIIQLRGEPNFSPDGLAARSHAEYVEGRTLRDMIKEDLIAERVAIESYREMIGYLGEQDTTTRRMLEEILAAEEEHADDLSSLLEGLTA